MTKTSIVAMIVLFGLTAWASGPQTVESADEIKAREQMAVEAARDPDARGVGGRPMYQSEEEREALQRTLTACIDSVDAALAALPADTPLADREAVLQRQRELSKLRGRYTAIEARRRSNIDRLQDRNASYGAPFGQDPALNSRSGLVANYAPYAENESTQLPGVPDYCFTMVDPSAENAENTPAAN